MRIQTCRKKYDRECFFCGETNEKVLDAHRILPGEKGGKYQWRNLLTVCSNCHRKVHAGEIVVQGKFLSTSGRHVVIYTVAGQEFMKSE